MCLGGQPIILQTDLSQRAAAKKDESYHYHTYPETCTEVESDVYRYYSATDKSNLNLKLQQILPDELVRVNNDIRTFAKLAPLHLHGHTGQSREPY